MLWILIGVVLTLFPQERGKITVQNQGCKVEFEPSGFTAKVGEHLEAQIIVRNAADLFSAPFHLVFDQEMVSIEDVIEGDFLSGDGKRTAFLKSVQPDKGTVIIGLARLGEVGGRSGSGKLISVRIVAKKRGQVKLSLQRLDFRDANLKPIAVSTTQLILTIQ